MIESLRNFTTEALFSATSKLLTRLHIQFDRETAEAIDVADLYDQPMPKYLTDALQCIESTYFIGIINDGSLQGMKSEDSLDDVEETLVHGGKYDGMFVFACDAKPEANLTRTAATALTRAFNRIASANPVILFIRQADMLSIATCERMEYSQEWRRGMGEKIGKVNILRNINCRNPHRGHYDILESLGDKSYPTFEELYKHWLEIFSSELLTKKFYNELSDWYAWAVMVAKFPNDLRTADDDEKFNHESCIRLITRLIFVWFLKQKHLIPEEFFDEKYIRDNFIENFDPHDRRNLMYDAEKSRYYRAILQNLFFATLNCPIVAEGNKTPSNRRFRKASNYHGKNADYNVNNLMRYEADFMEGGASKFLKMANNNVPFLNGGLFDCLDDKVRKFYYDGFSEHPDSLAQLYLPDWLFFGDEVGAGIDLSQWYGDAKKKCVSARGIIDILKRYSFTIEENTPYDQEVSLDPELLGKVFENLLAAYNPETKTSARKQTGSFYTPREIVQYMVNESLVAHLKRMCGDADEAKYRALLDYASVVEELTEDQRKNIMHALYNCRVLDPACGSGAFPMGILQQMVHVLKRIDPTNEMWKDLMIDQAIVQTKIAFTKDKEEERKARLDDIEEAFNTSLNDPDYARKLYLIEHCIYGVDIQPIATQISKLRFFISLVADQKPTKDNCTNFGIRPLPNLESKFVAANTLIPLDRNRNLFTASEEILEFEKQLQDINHRIFLAKRSSIKEKLRAEMLEVRNFMAHTLESLGAIGPDGYMQLTNWNMFDQNASAPFFDPEWMFGVKEGFDVVIANPPYKIVAKDDEMKSSYDSLYKVAHGGKRNLYHLFFEKGINSMITNGVLSYITPDTYFSGGDTEALRDYFLKTIDIKSIVHYTEKDKVFENVTQAVAVIVLTRNSIGTSFYIKEHDSLDEIVIAELKKENKYVFKASNPVINKIKKQTSSFGSICEGFKGDVNLGLKKDFFTNIESSETMPLVRGIQISKYTYNAGDEYCFKNALSRDHTSMERVVFQEVANMGLAHRVKGTMLKNVILGDSTNYIYSKVEAIDNYYVLALLNSKVVNYFFKYFNQTNHVPIGELKKIPFALAKISVQELLKTMTKQMISDAYKGKYRLDIEQQIDHIVYHLYNLTYDEVLVIDPETPITREEYDNYHVD